MRYAIATLAGIVAFLACSPSPPTRASRIEGCAQAGLGMSVDDRSVFLAFDCPDGTKVLIPAPDMSPTPNAVPAPRPAPHERSA